MREETTITFLASECGELHGMGECIECTSLKEAFRHYRRFCKRSPQMVPSLEFSLHHADDPLYNEGEYPLATGERGKELLSCVPYYANHPLVQYVAEHKDGENVSTFCKQLYDLAMLAHKPLSPEEMTAFVQRSNEVMMLLTK